MILLDLLGILVIVLVLVVAYFLFWLGVNIAYKVDKFLQKIGFIKPPKKVTK